MPAEPDLSAIVDLAADRLCLRNVIYTAWSLFHASPEGGYAKWDVAKIADGKGYVLEFLFEQGFSIALQDMQTLHDACPLRIDSIFIKDAAAVSEENRGIKLCVCLLNAEQPVQLTEMDIVRIRKRSRGLLGTARDFFAKKR
jgi:hypothetical protein